MTDFADVVLVFDEDEDAVEHVLEDGLGSEADADADEYRLRRATAGMGCRRCSESAEK